MRHLPDNPSLGFLRKEAKDLLAAAKASYSSLLTTPVHDYTVAGDNTRKHKLKELWDEIERLTALETEIKIETGVITATPNVAYTRFSRPS